MAKRKFKVPIVAPSLAAAKKLARKKPLEFKKFVGIIPLKKKIFPGKLLTKKSLVNLRKHRARIRANSLLARKPFGSTVTVDGITFKKIRLSHGVVILDISS